MDPFIDTSRVAVRDGSDTFWIKRKMDFGTRCQVEDTLTRMAIVDGQSGDLQFTLGAQKLALAIHNIVAWEGPHFDGIPCTPENIQRLDADYPVFRKARDEIMRLNTHTETPDPKAAMTTGAPSSTANDRPSAVVDGPST